MARTFRRQEVAVGLLVLVSIVLSSCGGVPKFWIQKYREMPDIGDLEEWQRNDKDRRTLKEKNQDIERYYRSHYLNPIDTLFAADPIKVDESMLVVRNEVDGVITPTPSRCPAGAKLTFAHLSDVQLRDEQVRLYDKETSKLADNIIPSFEHHPFVEAFDGALYYAVVQSLNATARDTTREEARRPLLMIHTGDAIDAGVLTELFEFLYISNELEIPWYNTIGNHDLGTFGNIEPEDIYVNDPFVDFMTIHNKLAFINMHDRPEQFSALAPNVPSNSNDDRGLDMDDALYTRYNGFDRLKYTPEEIQDELIICEEAPGYYSLEVKARDETTGDPAIQMIVLDTGFSFGAHGEIDKVQFRWLENQIEKCSDKLVLVFGHHNMDTIKDSGKLIDLFGRYPSVIAYLCGHKHYHSINYYSGAGGGFGFWEVITDAIFAYPQQGSLVTISYDGEVGLLDVYAFNHTVRQTYTDKDGNKQPSELYTQAQLADQGAVKDISDEERRGVDSNIEDRYARLRFPYPTH